MQPLARGSISWRSPGRIIDDRVAETQVERAHRQTAVAIETEAGEEKKPDGTGVVACLPTVEPTDPLAIESRRPTRAIVLSPLLSRRARGMPIARTGAPPRSSPGVAPTRRDGTARSAAGATS